MHKNRQTEMTMIMQYHNINNNNMLILSVVQLMIGMQYLTPEGMRSSQKRVLKKKRKTETLIRILSSVRAKENVKHY